MILWLFTALWIYVLLLLLLLFLLLCCLCTFIIIIIISPALLFCVQSCDDDEEDDTDDGDVTIHFKCRCNYSSHALRLVNSTLTATVVKTKSVVTQDTRHCVRRQRRWKLPCHWQLLIWTAGGMSSILCDSSSFDSVAAVLIAVCQCTTTSSNSSSEATEASRSALSTSPQNTIYTCTIRVANERFDKLHTNCHAWLAGAMDAVVYSHGIIGFRLARSVRRTDGRLSTAALWLHEILRVSTTLQRLINSLNRTTTHIAYTATCPWQITHTDLEYVSVYLSLSKFKFSSHTWIITTKKLHYISAIQQLVGDSLDNVVYMGHVAIVYELS